MNKYLRTAVCLPTGIMKVCLLKILHPQKFRGSLLSVVSPFTEITLDHGGALNIGRGFKMRDGAKLRVRKGSECILGKNVSMNSNDMIVCRDRITIGDGVQFSPNVQVYDHDHDFRVAGGIGAKKYRTSPVSIGDNCWIGANTVILRGTKLGNNCVVGAGCVLRGEYPDNCVIVQKRENKISKISG